MQTDNDDQEISEFDMGGGRPARHAARVIRDLVSDLIDEPEPRNPVEYSSRAKRLMR